MSDDEFTWTFRLTDALNTHNPALAVLRDKGYHLYFIADERPEFYGDYWAIQDGRVFIGSSPVALLGLVALWEHFGDEWRDRVTEDILSQVNYVPAIDNDFASLEDDAFQWQAAHFRLLFDAIGEPLPVDVSRTELSRAVRDLILSSSEQSVE